MEMMVVKERKKKKRNANNNKENINKYIIYNKLNYYPIEINNNY